MYAGTVRGSRKGAGDGLFRHPGESQSVAAPLHVSGPGPDRADESFAFDLNAMRTPEGRIARVKIGTYALTHPHLLPDLFRLKGRAEKAANELGEFLANCRIKPDSRTGPTD